FSSRRWHTSWPRDWSSDVCSSDLALWSTIKITQPVIQFFDVDCSDWTIPKVCAECSETLFQIGNVRRAHPVLALCFQHLFRQFRSEERRVGTECRSQWSTSLKK